MVAETPARRRAALSLIACVSLAAACQSTSERTAPPPERPATAPVERPTPTRAPRRLAAVRLPTATVESDDTATRRLLREKAISRLQLTEETGGYLEVLKLVRTVTGIPIVVSPEARAVIADEALVLEMNIVAPLSVANLLDLMVSKSSQLGWTVRHGVAMVTAKAEARGDLVLRTHDVRDLIFARTEFLPPVIRDIPTGELETEGPRSGGEGDEKVSAVEPDVLVETVKLATGPESWDTEGGGTIEYLDSGYLLVHATPAMQRAVDRALLGMR